MITIDLKKYIYDNQKIEYVLETIGNTHIKYHPDKEYYSCCNYNGDNQTAVNVKNNEYINVTNWTRQNEFPNGSDIITLVQYNKQYSFVEAIKYLHSILNIEYTYQKKPQKIQEKEKYDPLEIFKRIKNKSKRLRVNVDNIHVLDEEILDTFIPLLHVDWVKEGVTERARKKFGICYSYKKSRIIIPIRHWLTKELVGFNMRTTVLNYEELDIPKYLITTSYQKSQNMYGLAENYDSIQKAGYVTVFEGEKSVLKRCSLFDDTCVALQGHALSSEQVAILIGMNVEVILAFDKDISIDEIRFSCERFFRIRQVSYIYDKWNLLSEKQSPADASNKIYNFLFKHRVKYTESEHQQYLKSLEKK